MSQGESNSQNNVSKILINSMNDSYFFTTKIAEDTDNQIPLNIKKKYSVALPFNQSKSISQKMQEPLMSLGNLFKKKTVFDETKQVKKQNNDINSNTHSNKKIDTTNTNQSKSNDNDIIVINNDNDQYLDLDSYFDEHFKIYYITPIILELSSDLFYDNINMCIHMSWFNEINRYLKISISIPEHIYIYTSK